MTEICLELKDIRKGFSEEEEVLKGISLSIAKGKLSRFLDLRAVARPQPSELLQVLKHRMRDSVFLDGKDVTKLKPKVRDVNTVFQIMPFFLI